MSWNAETNSLRAHYSKFIMIIFSISGDGKLVYFNKKNLLTNSLGFKFANNISQILEQIILIDWNQRFIFFLMIKFIFP